MKTKQQTKQEIMQSLTGLALMIGSEDYTTEQIARAIENIAAKVNTL